jgi:hypothetical protein
MSLMFAPTDRSSFDGRALQRWLHRVAPGEALEGRGALHHRLRLEAQRAHVGTTHWFAHATHAYMERCHMPLYSVMSQRPLAQDSRTNW